jgi:ribonuclease VapC
LIALDTSALVAIIRREAEAASFLKLMTDEGGLVGAPTALEFHMVLSSIFKGDAAKAANVLLESSAITIVSFTDDLLMLSRRAFDRYGKGRHRARLNYGDCMSYAVAMAFDAPLLFKGDDFIHTDVRPAYQPAP